VSNKGPSWIGIGAQRCGTTWFTDLLVQHPHMDVPGGKKEHHWLYRFGLTQDLSPADRRDYRAAFTDDKVKLGEFTPYYLRAPWICELAADLLPKDCPILVLLRDPIDRFASALRHEMELATRRYRKHTRMAAQRKREGNEPRRRRVPAGGSKKARGRRLLSRVGTATSALWAHEPPQEPSEAFLDRTWLRFVGSDVSWGGMYAAHLDAWTATLPEDRFIVIQYEKLRQNPKRYTELVWDRLGLEPISLAEVDRRSRSSTNSESWRPEEHPHVVRALQRMYRPDAERLASRFNIDLGLWERTMTEHVG
jgi:hypothetical protein